jgi:translation initiation factor 2B subunit (eIF-2B alpha/beta/delta family)
MCETEALVFESVAADVRSGASTLVLEAARELIGAVEAIEANDPGTCWNALVGIAGELVWAKRDMAPFVNLASDVLSAAERGALSGSSPDVMKSAAVSVAAELLEFAEADIERLCEEALKTLPPCASAATLSSSTAVEATLRRLGPRVERLYVAESRPALEGVGLAERLASSGLSPTIVADAALPGLVGSVDIVLTGADAVTERSFVNKAGSYALALAAREADVPLFVLAETRKILPEGLTRRPAPGDPAGLHPEPPDGISVENVLFEPVPLALVRAVVTEDGPLGPGELEPLLLKRPIAPALLEILFPRRPRGDV